MRLLADGGSTKVAWAIETPDGQWLRKVTPGLNPVMTDSDELARRINDELLPLLDSTIPDEIHYFGAGCTAVHSPVMARLLSEATGCDSVEVDSDILGAARALCGDSPGIACICGTGSNSCLYDGHSIVDSVSPLGYILGDEGSGASIGRRLIGDIYKRLMPKEIVEQFFQTFQLTQAEVIDRVYRRPGANRFLASMMPFVRENIGCEPIESLVVDEFVRFLRRNVENYADCRSLPVNFTGSVAVHFRPQMGKALSLRGLTPGRIEADPIEGLIRYYSSPSFSRRK